MKRFKSFNVIFPRIMPCRNNSRNFGYFQVDNVLYTAYSSAGYQMHIRELLQDLLV